MNKKTIYISKASKRTPFPRYYKQENKQVKYTDDEIWKVSNLSVEDFKSMIKADEFEEVK